MIRKELSILEERIFEILENKKDIYEDINNFVLNSSKRIRSKLAILYIKANDKELSDDIYAVLVASELIHNASLLHDDVIDDNNLRRGGKTIGLKYSSELSILAGDYLLSLAVKSLLKVNNNEVLTKFLNCTQMMSQAEILQLLNRGTMPKEEEYIKICRGKTAKLFEAMLESIALLLNLDGGNAQSLGKNFGILFQLKNDISPLSRENDKKNKIYTAIDIFDIEKTNSLIDNYREEILSSIKQYSRREYRDAIEDLLNSL